MTKNRLQFKGELFTKAKMEGKELNDVLREEYKDLLNAEYSDDKRSVVNIAMQEAGFTRSSSMYDVLNYSQSSQNSDLLFPAFLDETLKIITENETQMIIYPDLIAQQMTIAGTDFKSIFLDWTDEHNYENLLWNGLEEYSEIPTVTARTGEQSLKIYKNGVAMKESYETMRRMKIDIIKVHYQALAVKLGLQNLHEIISTLIEGDGNNNAIPDKMKFKSTPGGITQMDLVMTALDFNDFSQGLVADRYLCTKGAYAALSQMFLDTNNVNAFAAGAFFQFPQNILNGAKVYNVRDLPLAEGGKERIIMLNKDNGVRRIVEAGSEIKEDEKKSSNQSHAFYMTENVGYQKINVNAVAEFVIEPAVAGVQAVSTSTKTK